MFKLFSVGLLSAAIVLAPAFEAEAKSAKKSKMKATEIEQVVSTPKPVKPAPKPVVVAPAPAPAPKPAIDPYTQSQINKALARPTLHPLASCTYCAAYAASQGDFATVEAIGSTYTPPAAPAATPEATPAPAPAETPSAPASEPAPEAALAVSQ